MIKTTKAFVFIYVIFLVIFALTLVAIFLNNSSTVLNESEFNDLESRFLENIKLQYEISKKNNDFFNSNGSGIIDNISCPKNFSMSGSIYNGINSSGAIIYSSASSGSINSNLSLSGGINNYKCRAEFNSKDIDFYFNSGFTDLSFASYSGSTGSINSTKLTHFFPDGFSGSTGGILLDLKNINNYLTQDGVDDNFNSDNNRIDLGTSTGSFFEDDDNKARKNIFGYTKFGEGFKKAFWSNTKISDFIDRNKNNNDNLNLSLSNSTGALLFLDIKNNYSMKIISFSKNKFDDYKEFFILNNYDFYGATGSGFFQRNGNLSPIKTGNEFIFDFSSKDYAIFFESFVDEFVSYNLSFIQGNKGVYINPINDSGGDFRYLGNDIIIDKNFYKYKILEF